MSRWDKDKVCGTQAKVLLFFDRINKIISILPELSAYQLKDYAQTADKPFIAQSFNQVDYGSDI